MTAKATTTIYPVPGHFIVGVADVETETDAKTAAALVATGAFTYDPPTEAPATPAPEEE